MTDNRQKLIEIENLRKYLLLKTTFWNTRYTNVNFINSYFSKHINNTWAIDMLENLLS